jgi:hypothetical protein
MAYGSQEKDPLPKYHELPLIPEDSPEPEATPDPIGLVVKYEDMLKYPEKHQPVRILSRVSNTQVRASNEVFCYESLKSWINQYQSDYPNAKTIRHPTHGDGFTIADIRREVEL